MYDSYASLLNFLYFIYKIPTECVLVFYDSKFAHLGLKSHVKDCDVMSYSLSHETLNRGVE